jgi:hypothetical protein
MGLILIIETIVCIILLLLLIRSNRKRTQNLVLSSINFGLVFVEKNTVIEISAIPVYTKTGEIQGGLMKIEDSV